MAELVADCPRCGARRITLDVTDAHILSTEYGWKRSYEAFCICRDCNKATIFVLSDSVGADYKHVHDTGLVNLKTSLNNFVRIERFVSLRDVVSISPPEHLPK